MFISNNILNVFIAYGQLFCKCHDICLKTLAIKNKKEVYKLNKYIFVTIQAAFTKIHTNIQNSSLYILGKLQTIPSFS